MQSGSNGQPMIAGYSSPFKNELTRLAFFNIQDRMLRNFQHDRIWVILGSKIDGMVCNINDVCQPMI
jgi:hypothetical protein